MNIPSNLLYTKTHEWVQLLDNGNAVIGITDYAQEQLSDVVFVNLHDPGEVLAAHDSMGDVESIKAVSELYAPIGGTIEKVNEEVFDSPELLNEQPYEAWLLELSDVSDTDVLLTPQEYEEILAQEQH